MTELNRRARLILAIIVVLSILGIADTVYLIDLHYSNPTHIRNLRNTLPFLRPHLLDPDDPYDRARLGTADSRKACDLTDYLNCSCVDNSPYSEIGGIGVSIFGLIGYVILLILSLWAVVIKSKNFRFVHLLIFSGSSVGFLYTAWLNYIEFFVIRCLCPECTISAFLITVIFVLSAVTFGKSAIKLIISPFL